MKTLALSTAIVTLTTGLAFAQTAPAPDASNPTTGTGQQQAPLTGQEAAPVAPQRDTGNEGGAPAVDAQSAPETSATPDTTTTPDAQPGTAQPDGETDDARTGEAPESGMRADDNETADVSPATPPEGYEAVMMETLNADMLVDASVYDSDENSVGSISEVMPEQGMPEQVIVDVGGFLGIGAKPVALNVSELQFFKQTDGEEVRGYTTMTEDQLKDLPEYEG